MGASVVADVLQQADCNLLVLNLHGALSVACTAHHDDNSIIIIIIIIIQYNYYYYHALVVTAHHYRRRHCATVAVVAEDLVVVVVVAVVFALVADDIVIEGIDGATLGRGRKLHRRRAVLAHPAAATISRPRS